VDKPAEIEISGSMRLWWWLSVPYAFLFSVLVLLFQPTPGMLAHVLFPLLLPFELAWCSSILWTFATAIRMFMKRRASRLDIAMVAAAATASMLSVYVRFFWTDNLT
jgi:hypothetical protein